jgi:dTDP-4-amino-4,6-dideoxy-D-galactose acyltransferase
MQLEHKYLIWDSQYFGYPIGQANIREFRKDEYKELRNVFTSQNFKLVYLFPSDEESLNTLKEVELQLMDTKITFKKTKECFIHHNILDSVETYSGLEQYDTLKYLALISGEYSRYNIDKQFRNNEYEILYIEWLRRSINREIANDVLVYKFNSKIIGFVTYKIDADDLVIGLIAVDKTMQGRGVGKTLMNAVENIAIQKNLRSIVVSTQERNKGAMTFYSSLDYIIKAKKDIFHLWL